MYQNTSKKESAIEFGNIFKVACDELKEQSGNTHQSGGYIPELNVILRGMAFSK